MRTEGTTATAFAMEARVVGGILARGDAFHELPAGFSSAMLEPGIVRRAFEGIEALARKGKLPSGPVDHSLVIAEAKLTDAAKETLADMEAMASEVLTRGTPIADSARTLRDRKRRGELATLLVAASKALQGDADTTEVVGKITARLLDLDTSERPETRTWREAGLEWLDVLERAQKGEVPSVRTGFADLDRLVRMTGGKLVILGARPSVGKSTLALNIADNVAVRGEHVLVHSLEMDDAELVTLVLSRATETDSTAFGEPDGAIQWDRLMGEVDIRCRADAKAGDGTLHMNTAHHSLGAICRITEKMHRKYGLSLVVVDYLQLVDCKLGKGFTRNDEVSAISRTLKLLAMRLRVPILALSQLNRAGEKRNEPVPRRKKDESQGEPDVPPPQLHDLRDSGAVEQDANTVLFLHNPRANSKDEHERKRGPYQLTVAKNRGGKKGRVMLRAELEYARFRSAAPTAATPPTRWTPQDREDT